MVRHGRLGRPRGPRPPTRVGELETDDEIVGRAAGAAVGVDQLLAQRGECARRGAVDDELAGVGPAVRPDRHRLPAPHELGAALAEPPPPAPHEVGGPAVGGAVPPLHRQHGEAVADGPLARRSVPHGVRLGQGPARVDPLVGPDGRGDPERGQPRLQVGERAQALDLHERAQRRRLQALDDVDEDRPLGRRVGPADRTGRGAVGGDPAPGVQHDGGVVAVGGNGGAERVEPEVLQQVVELAERRVARRPPAVALGEGVGRERRQPEQVVGAVADHVDGQVVAGEHEEVGTDAVADRQAVPLGTAGTATSAWPRCRRRPRAAPRRRRASRCGRGARTSSRARRR